MHRNEQTPPIARRLSLDASVKTGTIYCGGSKTNAIGMNEALVKNPKNSLAWGEYQSKIRQTSSKLLYFYPIFLTCEAMKDSTVRVTMNLARTLPNETGSTEC